MIIYYAHSKKIYNTKREEEERNKILQKFPKAELICPNRDVGEKFSLVPYLKIVRDCNIVVCSEFDGFVGKGVYWEILTAMDNNKPVFNVTKDFKKVTDIIIVDKNDWTVKYGKVVC